MQVTDSGSNTIVTYSLDALAHRVTETRGSTSTDLCYSSDWQGLEERVSGTAKAQFVWSPVYVDALVERDWDADGNTGNGLEERLYAQQDANWNVTGLVNASGSVVERYAYDPYGLPTFLTPAWGSLGSSGYSWSRLHQGNPYDAATGNSNSRERDTRATIQRFLNPDPILFGAGDPNFYRLEGNHPTGAVDPYGLDEQAAAGWSLWDHGKRIVWDRAIVGNTNVMHGLVPSTILTKQAVRLVMTGRMDQNEFARDTVGVLVPGATLGSGVVETVASGDPERIGGLFVPTLPLAGAIGRGDVEKAEVEGGRLGAQLLIVVATERLCRLTASGRSESDFVGPPKPTGKNMLPGAIKAARSVARNLQARTNALINEFEQIEQRTGGDWKARPGKGTDGSSLFSDRTGQHVIIVDPEGGLHKGAFGTSITLTDQGLTPNYKHPKMIHLD